jgi:hypothetical protein
MDSYSRRHPFIFAAATRQAAQKGSPAMVVTDDLAALLAARSADAILRSRALLARTRHMLGMEHSEQRLRK